MLLNEKQKVHLFRFIDNVSNEMTGRSYWYTMTIRKIVLIDDLYRALFYYDKYPELIESIPKTYRKKVLRALEELRKNINKTRKLLLEKPPDWVKNAVLLEFLREFYPVSSIPILEEHRDELLGIVPIEVDSWDEVTYKGKNFAGLILYPTEKELANLEIHNVGKLYRGYFIDLVEQVIKFIPEKQSVKIYDFEMFFPRKDYYKILKRFGRYDDIVLLVKEDMGEALNELEQIGEINLRHDRISINVRPEIIKRINSEYGLDIKEIEIYLEYDPSTGKSKGSGKIWAKLSTGTLSISKPYNNICYSGRCRDNDMTEFEFKNYSELPKLVHFMINRVAEITAFTKDIENRFIKVGKTKGYKLLDYRGIDYVNAYSISSKFTLYKETDKHRVKVTLYINYEKKEISASYEVYVWIRRNLPADVKEEFEHRMIIEGINRTFKMNVKQRNYWNIISDSVKLTPDLTGLDKIFDEAEKVANIASEVYNNYIVETKKKREEIKLTPEQYVAIYITNSIDSGSGLPVERVTGRPEIVMYSVISRIASKHGVGGSPAKDSQFITIGLFEAGYITVDEDFKVYINGKRYVDLLKPLLKDTLPTILISWERNIAEWLISMYLLREVGGGLSRKGYIKALYKKGLFSDKVMYEVVSSCKIYIPPEDMTYKIDGKPAWHHLSPTTKKLYIESIYLVDKEKIYFDPALSTLFNDFIKDIEKDLIESGDPSILTKIAVNRKPNIIGLSRREDIRVIRGRDGIFYGIDMGVFVVQVNNFNTTPSGEHEFIVYRKDTKVGFIFRGKTLGDAVAEASSRYDKIYRIYKKISKEYTEKRKVGDGYILMHRRIGEYMLPYLIKKNKILYINEQTPFLVKRKARLEVEEVM